MNNFKIVTDDDRTYECKFVDDRWDILHTDENDNRPHLIASNLEHADILDKVWWHDMYYRRVQRLLNQDTNESIRSNLVRDYERVRREETR
jgi:hypothetical protein